MTVTSTAPLPDDAVRSVVDEPATTSPERPASLTTPMSIVWRLGQSDGDGWANRSARNAALSPLAHQRGRNSKTAKRHTAAVDSAGGDVARSAGRPFVTIGLKTTRLRVTIKACQLPVKIARDSPDEGSLREMSGSPLGAVGNVPMVVGPDSLLHIHPPTPESGADGLGSCPELPVVQGAVKNSQSPAKACASRDDMSMETKRR